jgi:hypothetical protein
MRYLEVELEKHTQHYTSTHLLGACYADAAYAARSDYHR